MNAAFGETRQQGEHRAFPTPAAGSRRPRTACEQVGDPVAEQDAPTMAPDICPASIRASWLNSIMGRPINRTNWLRADVSMGKNHPFNDAKQDDAKWEPAWKGWTAWEPRILFVQSIRSRKLYTVRRRYAMGKTAPSPCLGYPGMSPCRLSHPSRLCIFFSRWYS